MVAAVSDETDRTGGKVQHHGGSNDDDDDDDKLNVFGLQFPSWVYPWQLRYATQSQ
eukprot:CAMPEP_0119022680 /NCGR_PEP_ID=MMETSP1176-20130426/28526_1 /TAXON_ID=265551 /ORGANISM="Synedropsis recta cf, Strain CCMP1620" /LENGTH=55 /DNA_ID=CAMNT_0006977599 /DNA_START=21 /DNA_END=188 /DNA_ORIENTATION=-